MKKNAKRILALLLCAVMCISVASPALAAYYAAGTVVEDDGTDGEIAAGTVVDEDEQPTITLPQDNAVYTAGTVVDEDTEQNNIDSIQQPSTEIDPSIPITQPDEFPEPRVVEVTEENISEEGIARYAAPKSATLYIQDANVLAPAASSMSGFTHKVSSKHHAISWR